VGTSAEMHLPGSEFGELQLAMGNVFKVAD
jgi:hypothetical protein